VYLGHIDQAITKKRRQAYLVTLWTSAFRP